MKVSYKIKIITGLVIAFELLSLYYVYPKRDTIRANSFEFLLSRVCINSSDLFEANKRCELFVARTREMDERKIMYYADLIPEHNKKYLIYFEPFPFELKRYYRPTVEDGTIIYLLKGLTWRKFREMFCFIIEGNRKEDMPYVVTRN